MLKEMVVDVSSRQSGKNESRRLRRQSFIPGIVYGGDRPPVPVSVERRAITEILRSESGSNTLFTLRLDGQEDKKRVVMVRDVQRDPLAGALIHADFVRIDMSKRIEVEVRVQLAGTAIGVKEGGLLDFVNREVEVSCLPTDIPDSIVFDVSELAVGQHVEAGQLVMPEGVELRSEPDMVILVISTPRLEEEAAAPVAEGAEAEAAEPELVKKGKEGEEEEAESGAGKGAAGGKGGGKAD